MRADVHYRGCACVGARATEVKVKVKRANGTESAERGWWLLVVVFCVAGRLQRFFSVTAGSPVHKIKCKY